MEDLNKAETDDQIIARLKEEGLIDESGLVKQEVTKKAQTGKRVVAQDVTPAHGIAGLKMRDGFSTNPEEIGQTPHLIDGMLEQQSTAWLVGPSGSYKTFTATSLAACVATGREWFGKETLQGSVIYVCAEGGRAWDKRMQAYKQVHGLPELEDRSLLLMRPLPIQIGSPDWDALGGVIAQVKPVLVVIDTQAQCTLEYEENSNTEMAQAVSHLTALSQRSGACVLTVHHSGHAGESRGVRGRGASAVYAAADTELTMTPGEDDRDGLKTPYVRLSATKQKDMETGDLLHLKPDVVALDNVADWKGRPVTSVVMKPYEPEEEEESMTAEGWAARLIRAGLTEPMGRDRLTAAAKAFGIELPGAKKSREEITRVHKQKTTSAG